MARFTIDLFHIRTTASDSFSATNRPLTGLRKEVGEAEASPERGLGEVKS